MIAFGMNAVPALEAMVARRNARMAQEQMDWYVRTYCGVTSENLGANTVQGGAGGGVTMYGGAGGGGFGFSKPNPQNAMRYDHTHASTCAGCGAPCTVLEQACSYCRRPR